MADQAIFHQGEQSVQTRLGVRESIEAWAGKVVRPELPEQHRAFYAALPFLVASARDAQGRPWATILSKSPGFACSPDPKHLVVDAMPVSGDALSGQLVPGAELGLLGIELATRRRNRANGRIDIAKAEGFRLEVGQSFGNCPQYIREREWEQVTTSEAPPAKQGTRFTADQRIRIESADTFFIASGHRGEGNAASYGLDASHRGGAPGFVRVVDERHLIFPDYAGNNHFNTLGNLVADERAGLLFVDFESGGLLQLTGRAAIDWNSPAVADHPGARRLVAFELDTLIDLPEALPLRWRVTGDAVRTLRLTEKRRESEDVVSFHFEARDGGPLPDFVSGQHLPIELTVPGVSDPVRRTYSLSNAPGEGSYRISVKREARGVASRFLHDELAVGDFVDARAPAGEFVLEHGERPIVLISAGIGLTPMLSMLRALVASDDPRPVTFAHVARDGNHHPLAEEVRTLTAKNDRSARHVSYSRPTPSDVAGRNFDAAGRLDTPCLEAILRALDSDIYLCGPVAFMATIQDSLESLGVSPERIHSERFGPTG